MAYISLTDEEIEAGKPVKQEVLNTIQDDLDDLDSRVGTIESLPTVTLPNNKMLIGNASNVPTAVTISGDVTTTNTGVVTIGSDAVTTTKVLNSAITTAKINDGAVTSLKRAINYALTSNTGSPNSTSTAATSVMSTSITTLRNGVRVSVTANTTGSSSYVRIDGTNNPNTGYVRIKRDSVTIQKWALTNGDATGARQDQLTMFVLEDLDIGGTPGTYTYEVTIETGHASGTYIEMTNAKLTLIEM